MEIYEAMSTLRAVRRLRGDPIPEEVLTRVFTAATWAPTGGNRQPWRIVAVRDPATKRAFEDLYRPHWDRYLESYRKSTQSLGDAEQRKSARAMQAGDHLARHLHEVPVIAVFCYNPSMMTITDSELGRPSVVGGGSVYPAVQNLLLACRTEGLGCVLTTLLCLDESTIRTLLKLPEGWFTCAHVPIGYPVARGHGPITRKPLGKMVFNDTFGA